MEKPLSVSKQYRVYALNTLASHFGIPKDELRGEVDLDNSDILEFDALKELGFNYSVYATHIDKLKLDTFLKYKTFSKSMIYSEYINGKGMIDSDNYLMYMHFNGLAWFIYEAEFYNGLGGMFLCEDEDSKTGFIIEPCSNFLAVNFPKEEA